MANVQHIYKCNGDPNDIIPTTTDQACHHAIDELTGDIYISNGAFWLLTAAGQTDGAVSGLAQSGAPTVKPVGWPIKLLVDDLTGDMYLSVYDGSSAEWYKFTGTKVIIA